MAEGWTYDDWGQYWHTGKQSVTVSGSGGTLPAPAHKAGFETKAEYCRSDGTCSSVRVSANGTVHYDGTAIGGDYETVELIYWPDGWDCWDAPNYQACVEDDLGSGEWAPADVAGSVPGTWATAAGSLVDTAEVVGDGFDGLGADLMLIGGLGLAIGVVLLLLQRGWGLVRGTAR